MQSQEDTIPSGKGIRKALIYIKLLNNLKGRNLLKIILVWAHLVPLSHGFIMIE